ncbi:MAG: NACHT domain-containing protein [Snowella sp.]|nr:NACHT domain-containing protein [Snowella sp.]
MASQDQNIDHSEIKNSNVQQVQAGRDAVSFNNSRDNQVVIENTFVRLFGRSESSQVDWDWAKLLLEKKQLPEIRKRLTDTLGRERILMDVSIAEQQAWVNRLQADRHLQVNGKDGDLLDPNKLLIETFGRDDIAGKLLILGAPGSGKTTALLSLAEQLVIGAINQPQTVIPVILELSTWREDNQSIEAWIVEQLYDLHGGNRKRKIYEQWLERQVLLPLLDGLDELGLEWQKKCTEKLNEFARTYPQLVVCCRVKEFETANIKLNNLNGAICLQELSDGQIEAYFQSINWAELGSEMKTNSVLQGLLQETAEGEPGLLRVPLFIKLLADVYDHQEIIKNKADLLEKYIERQLSFDQRERDHRKGMKNHRWAYKAVEKEPKLDETINSLSWVARQLQANNTVELLIERIQPNWIESMPKQRQYQHLCSLVVCIIIFPIFLGTLGLIKLGMRGLIIGILLGVILTSANGFYLLLVTSILNFFSSSTKINEIKPIEELKISNIYSKKKKVFFSLKMAFSIGFFSLTFIIILKSIYAVPIGIINALIITLLVESSQELKIKNSPNKGIFKSLENMFKIAMFLIFFEFSLLFFLNKQIMFDIFVKNHIEIYVFMISWPLILSYHFAGGEAALKHFSLRLILWQSGTIPWNFARFLNYCVERRLLLRVGGRYRFLHRELLDYFAQLPPGTQIK